ncbi:MAG: DUF4298 domain-containing protein [Oscillospiraceae bacterium]|nr:DUF4298 domain-containing protein [Oscillospiraceae bacterium]
MAFPTVMERYGDPDAETVLIQMTDRRELPGLEREAAILSGLTDLPYQLVAVAAEDWNRDLSAWEAPPVFGGKAFGSGAAGTLAWLLDELLPSMRAGGKERFFYLGGYSLAGLFALWAAYQTDRFAGIAAVSPSVWFPGFTEYTRRRGIRTRAVYMSLGDREERTRNPDMARVGDAAREIAGRLTESGLPCCLEWNPGNHFREPERRTARGFAWLLDRRARQLRRIERCEAFLTLAQRALDLPEGSPQDPAAVREAVSALRDYYESDDWKQDFLDDEAGILPGSLRRGVLSEDGIYNVLEAFEDRDI